MPESPPTRWRWTREELDALRFLRLLAIRRAGYELQGVRGWAHITDLRDHLAGYFPEVLPRLHKRALVTRADVRAPGQKRPMWVYRISERGLAVMNEAEPKEHKRVPRPRMNDTGGVVYAPSRQRGALRLLREGYDDPAVPERFGGCGWVSGRELGARVDLYNAQQRRERQPHIAIDGTDLHWLIRWGFAERRNDPHRAGVVYWRATEAGREVRLLDWKTLPAWE